VVSGGDELDDDARERTAKAMASAACLNACGNDDEVRLEELLATMALVTNVGVDTLRIGTRGGCQGVSWTTGNRGESRLDGGVPCGRRKRARAVAVERSSGEQFCCTGGDLTEGREGEMERGQWGVKGRRLGSSSGSGVEGKR
jgi:hypothetical protein